MSLVGTVYFILKSSVLTFFIVCFLQIKIGSHTFEDRIMNSVRNTFAPQILNVQTDYIKSGRYKIGPKELKKVKERIYKSEMLKDVRKKTKDLFLKEMTEVFSKSENNDKNKD